MRFTRFELTHGMVLNASPIPTSIVDACGTIVDVNNAFLAYASKMGGEEIRRKDRVGRNAREFVKGGREYHKQDWLEFFDHVLKQGETIHLPQVHFLLLDMDMYVDVHMSPIKQNGEIAGAILVWQDVTKQVNALKEEQRRAGLDRVRVSVYEMRESTDIQNVLVSLYDALGNVGVEFEGCSVQIIYEGKGCFRGYGLRSDGVYPMRERPLMDSAVYDAWRDKRPVYRRSLDKEDRYSSGKRLREVSDRHIRSVLDVPFSRGTIAINSVQPEAFSEKDIETLGQFAGVLSEAYTRLEDIQKIEESAEQWQDTFDAIEDLVAIVGRDYRVARANRAMREAFPNIKVVGAHCYELFHGIKEPLSDCPGCQVFLSGKATHLELCEQHLGSRWFDVFVYPVTDKGVTVQRVVHIVRDITERKQAEEALEQTRKKAEEQERLAAVGQLAAGIAHDFNNLLTGIMGFTELAKEDNDMPESLKPYLDNVLQGGQNAAQLVRQILDFSRKSLIQRQPLRMTMFLEKTSYFLKRTIPENIQIVLEMGGEYTVNTDSTQMQQVLTNLAVNAKDAMPEGGELRFCLSSLFLGHDEHPPVLDMKPGNWVALSVSDTGAGMLPEVKSRIFEPFFTTKDITEKHGTGLGLAQVYGIVAQHEGFIDVQSEVGKGTTFIIYLPVYMPEEVSIDEAAKVVYHGNGETILVVEDEPVVLELIRQMLERLNYQALRATNGKEALDIYTQHQDEIALVLTDMVMPGEMDGGLLFRTLKMYDSDIKVLIMSGYSLGQKEQELLSQGVAGWLQKPISMDELSRVIHEVLDS